MDSRQMQILKQLAKKIRSRFPEARILAFGSYARGTATEESDLDICVVLESVNPEDRLIISDMAWEVGFDHDILVSTIVIPEHEYEHGPLTHSPLIEAIRAEGVAA
jgi:uncharacterized protein